jgi:hypothetical protein
MPYPALSINPDRKLPHGAGAERLASLWPDFYVQKSGADGRPTYMILNNLAFFSDRIMWSSKAMRL